MGKELDTFNDLIKLSWDVPDLSTSGAGFLGLWYFTLRLLQRVVKSLCLVQEGSLSHSPCVCPVWPMSWAAPGCALPHSNASIHVQQSQLDYIWMMFSYPDCSALFSNAA